MRKLSWTAANDLIADFTKEVRSDQLCSSPVVSVCLMTYNHQHFICEAIESILAQRFNSPLEIIIGDDCSTDGTTQHILDYQCRHPEKMRVLLSTKNLGKYTGSGRLNLIRALRACRGNFIAMLEGDDYWTDRDKLQRQFDFLDSNPNYSGAFHDASVLEEDGTSGDPQLWWQFLGDQLDLTLEDTISRCVPFHTSSFTFRRDVAADLPSGFLQYISGDIPLYILASARGPLRRIPRQMSVYRKHAGGITRDPNRHGLNYPLQLWFMMRDLHRHLFPVGKDYFAELNRKYYFDLLSAWYRCTDSNERIEFLKTVLANRQPWFAVELIVRTVLRPVKAALRKCFVQSGILRIRE